MNQSQETNAFAGKRVLLLDGNSLQSLPMLRAFSRLGCAVDAVCPSRTNLGAVSRYGNRKIVVPVEPAREDEYIARLTEILTSERYDLVVPLADNSARLLSEHKEALSRYASIAVNDPGVFRAADDKLTTLRVCRENGIPCPKTYSASDSLDEIVRSVDAYPAALKPRVASGGKGFRKIESREELEKYYAPAVEKFGPMLVEEYIPQTGTQYKCDVYIDRGGVVKSAFVYEKPRWYPVAGGSSCCNVTVDRPDLIAHSVNLLQKLAWRGYADLDLIEDPRDGSVRIMEINPRICGSIKIAFLAGIDFARQIAEDAFGLPVTAYPDYKKNVVMRRFLADCAWFVKSPRRFRTRLGWFNPCFHGQIFSWDDPIPALVYLGKKLLRPFKRLRLGRRPAAPGQTPPPGAADRNV